MAGPESITSINPDLIPHANAQAGSSTTPKVEASEGSQGLLLNSEQPKEKKLSTFDRFKKSRHAKYMEAYMSFGEKHKVPNEILLMIKEDYVDKTKEDKTLMDDEWDTYLKNEISVREEEGGKPWSYSKKLVFIQSHNKMRTFQENEGSARYFHKRGNFMYRDYFENQENFIFSEEDEEEWLKPVLDARDICDEFEAKFKVKEDEWNAARTEERAAWTERKRTQLWKLSAKIQEKQLAETAAYEELLTARHEMYRALRLEDKEHYKEDLKTQEAGWPTKSKAAAAAERAAWRAQYQERGMIFS